MRRVRLVKTTPDPRLKGVRAKVSNAIWIKKSDLSRSQLEKVLSASHIYGEEKFDGSGTHELESHIEYGKYVGLPRGYFGDFFSQKLAVTDQKIKWPKWQWPEGWDWRPGQKDSVDAILEYFDGLPYGQCRLEAACGTGKTAMSLYVASLLRLRTLILVHKEDLAINFHKDAKQFLPGVKAGHCQQDSWVYRNCQFVTATFQTLYSRDTTIPKGFLSRFGLVLVDEAHRCPAATFEGVLRKFTAKYRLGVSATWRRRDGLDKVFEAHLGPIVHVAASRSLPAKYVRPKVSMGLKIINPRHWAYVVNGVAESEKYQDWLATEVVRAVLKGRRTPLVLADRIAMLKSLRKKIRKLFRSEGYPEKIVSLFIGESTRSQKRRSKQHADVILGSYGVFFEGVDVPRLDTIFLATPRSDIEQAVGRIRRIKEGKRYPLIVDPQFTRCSNPMLRSTGFARLRQYQRLGFTELKRKN